MLQWLRLHAAEYGCATALVAVRMLVLAHDVLVTALAVAQDRAQVALGTDGLDFADALHLLASSHCAEFISFDDRRFARRAKRLGVTPTVVVPSH